MANFLSVIGEVQICFNIQAIVVGWIVLVKRAIISLHLRFFFPIGSTSTFVTQSSRLMYIFAEPGGFNREDTQAIYCFNLECWKNLKKIGICQVFWAKPNGMLAAPHIAYASHLCRPAKVQVTWSFSVINISPDIILYGICISVIYK